MCAALGSLIAVLLMRISLCDLLAESLGPEGMRNRTGEFYRGRGRQTGVTRPVGPQNSVELESASVS